jgi:hypothetical protein
MYVDAVIPRANVEVLTKTAQQEISGLTGKDILIYCGGSNDIMKNNTSRGIKWIHHFLLRYRHTNIIIMGAPHSHDLMETSIVNEEVKVFNKKLNDVANKYGHTAMMYIDFVREDFTRHGLHIRNSGKDKLITLLMEKIEMQLQETQTRMPISLTWKEDVTMISADDQGIVSVVSQTIPCRRRRKIPIMRSEDFLWE